LTIETQNLRLPPSASRCPWSGRIQTPDGGPQTATRVSSLHTAFGPSPLSRAAADQVLWSEKTTVCRIFSCKRARIRSCGLATVERRAGAASRQLRRDQLLSQVCETGQERLSLNRPNFHLTACDPVDQARP
jgi:hypothetical protein